MAEHKPVHAKLPRKGAADRERVGIVIAGNPDPIASALQRGERVPIVRGHAAAAVAVMETIAECDHPPRRIAREEL